jgi:hypothetical protein
VVPVSRHLVLLEFEEKTRAELHEFGRRALGGPVPVQVVVVVGKPAEEIVDV